MLRLQRGHNARSVPQNAPRGFSESGSADHLSICSVILANVGASPLAFVTGPWWAKAELRAVEVVTLRKKRRLRGSGSSAPGTLCRRGFARRLEVAHFDSDRKVKWPKLRHAAVAKKKREHEFSRTNDRSDHAWSDDSDW